MPATRDCRESRRSTVRADENRHQRGQAADVILVRVRERDDVHGADAAVPQVGRHHVFADIELRRATAAERGDAAAIHQHAFAIGKDHQQAVALAHVDGGHLQLAGMELGRERVPEQQHQSAATPPAAARHQRPRATAAAISAAEIATASHSGGWECASWARCAACQLTTFCESHSSRPRPRATQCPAREDRDESDRDRQPHQRHHERIGREAGESHAVEVDHHGQRQAQSAPPRMTTVTS